MRTTLTLDDDVAVRLQELAQRRGKSFKDAVNDTLRKGLNAATAPSPVPDRFRVEAAARGFRPGVDVYRLNQLVDELDLDRFEGEATGDRER